ncbi:hypothetical protein [Streptomyces lydicus]|uniref:hypothetical protein n=1 Tax=Streptomyces lydicus TaxID=47763 RepID=UPI00131D5A74|nr:hypothetical protein [Streptomyces lydicus]
MRYVEEFPAAMSHNAENRKNEPMKKDETKRGEMCRPSTPKRDRQRCKEEQPAARPPRVRLLRDTRETVKSNELGPAPKVRAPATV